MLDSVSLIDAMPAKFNTDAAVPVPRLDRRHNLVADANDYVDAPSRLLVRPFVLHILADLRGEAVSTAESMVTHHQPPRSATDPAVPAPARTLLGEQSNYRAC